MLLLNGYSLLLDLLSKYGIILFMDDKKVYDDFLNYRQEAIKAFSIADSDELADLFWEPDYSEIGKGLGSIGKRYHEAKSRGTLPDELSDINTSYRAIEYQFQMKYLCRQILDTMEVRGARFYQDKPIALAKTADYLSAAIISTINCTKFNSSQDINRDLLEMMDNGLDTVEELVLFFPDFKPDTSSFKKIDGKFCFSDITIEELIKQFACYILDHWNRHFEVIKKQTIHDVKTELEPELGIELSPEEIEMGLKLGTSTIEDDKEEFCEKFNKKVLDRVNKELLGL